MESFEFNSTESWFVYKNEQILTDREKQTPRK